MHGKNAEEPIMCKVFPFTLANWALSWFHDLELGSIYSWGQLLRLFITRFGTPRPMLDLEQILRNVKQHPFETLEMYLERFNEEAMVFGSLDWKEKPFWIREGITKGTPFHQEISISPPLTYGEFLTQALKFIKYEEESHKIHGAPSGKVTMMEREVARLAEDGFAGCTPLVKSQAQIMKECCRKYFKYNTKPIPKRQERATHYKKWCYYHCSEGHDTNDFQALRREIEELIQQGKLQEYVLKWEDSPVQETKRKLHDEEPKRSRKRKICSEQEMKAYQLRLLEPYGGYTSESSGEDSGTAEKADTTRKECFGGTIGRKREPGVVVC